MIEVLKKHKNFIFFAFVVSFFSGFGQTYLLALFNQRLVHNLQISTLTLGKTYSLATFIAALFLPFIGGMIDRVDPRKLITLMSLALFVSFFALGRVKSLTQLFFCFVFMFLVLK